MGKRRKIIVFFACVLIILLGFGIYYYYAVQRIKLRLVGVDVPSAGLTSATVNFKVEIYNPNVLPVYIPSADFDIYINDQYLGSGNLGALTVGGNNRRVATVPITFSYINVAATVVSIIVNGGTATVKINGAAHFFILDVPFSFTQNIEFT